ncbi:site-specific integrase [Aeromonas media]|uniref:site-specific integrase n=1 Tax=Aeromonas media TaxID=651 RepID=UPI002B4A18A6|nr:site-specific integrase [Aeromonas media]
MVFVVHSSSFDVPRIYPSDRHQQTIQLKGFPTFYSQHGEYILPVNLWFHYLVNIKQEVDVSSAVRAIKRYWRFLEANGYEWNVFPASNTLKPTYRFRNDDLLKSARNGEIAFSTASLYILHVIKFYEWAMHEQLLSLSEAERPFNYQVVHIANTGMMSHLHPRFAVRSTDLRIRKPARHDHQKLNPLSEYELSRFAHCLKQGSDEFIIHQLLQIQSGLRVEEACTFPYSAVQAPDRHTAHYEVEIGPFNGVHTKYDKTRTVEIPQSLMQRMYEYAIGERRYLRAQRATPRGQHIPLLLNRQGAPFTSNNVQQHFRRLKQAMTREENGPFSHRTHDLRATYGTYRLDSLLAHLPEGDAMALVMAWMGHQDEKTTWKYLRYLRKEHANQSAVLMLDVIMAEALQ